MATGEWLKAKASGTGNCVELAVARGGVLVRDSKDPGPVLAFASPAWLWFLGAARAGHLDVLAR